MSHPFKEPESELRRIRKLYDAGDFQRANAALMHLATRLAESFYKTDLEDETPPDRLSIENKN